MKFGLNLDFNVILSPYVVARLENGYSGKGIMDIYGEAGISYDVTPAIGVGADFWLWGRDTFANTDEMGFDIWGKYTLADSWMKLSFGYELEPKDGKVALTFGYSF